MIKAKQPKRARSLLLRISRATIRWQILTGVLILAAIIVIAQALVAFERGSVASFAAGVVVSEPTNKDLVYLLRDDGTHAFTLTAVNLGSSSLVWAIRLGDCPIAKLSNDGQTLLLVDAETEAPYVSSLSAIDKHTGAAIWKARLNTFGLSYCSIIPNDRLWQSEDGRYVYLVASQQKANKIVIFDTNKKTVIRTVDVAVPYDPYDFKPRFWKLPWSEQMVVVSRDQLFLIDLSSAKTQPVGVLPSFTGRDVPKNLPQIVDVIGGDLAPSARRLYLATLAQEVIMVDFNVSPPVIEQTIKLPTGWQFTLVNPLIVQSDGQKVYLQVRQPKTRPPYSFDVDAIWIYENGAWEQPASRIELAKAPLLASALAKKPHLNSSGIVLSNDEQKVYSVIDNSILVTAYVAHNEVVNEPYAHTLLPLSEPTSELAKSWIVR
ncbi:MAG: hypothetical protein KatS3mg053_0445 [Candidatus Roseilinea sp.]|nr:MAG: hypothetical protein KatS3mg053_0445 [Candidatus Roseilinea sp.]